MGIFSFNPQCKGRHYYYPITINVKTKAQRVYRTCPRSTSWCPEMAEWAPGIVHVIIVFYGFSSKELPSSKCDRFWPESQSCWSVQRIFPLCHSLWRAFLFQHQILIEHLPCVSLYPQDGGDLGMFLWKHGIRWQFALWAVCWECLPTFLTPLPFS